MQLRTLITLHAAAATKRRSAPPDVRAREALKLVDSFGGAASKRATSGLLRAAPSSSGATRTASRCLMSWRSTVPRASAWTSARTSAGFKRSEALRRR